MFVCIGCIVRSELTVNRMSGTVLRQQATYNLAAGKPCALTGCVRRPREDAVPIRDSYTDGLIGEVVL